jgi:3-oxoacyl-[acyl-carrier protein] reductase
MDLGLTGKVAIVTGGSRGIGAAAARRLAMEGTSLMLVARTPDILAATAVKLAREHGVRVETWAGDLREPQAAGKAVTAAMDAFGRIDIAVTSAGASLGGLFWEIPDDIWEDSMALKFMATVRTMRAVVPIMRAQKAGRIVVVAGGSGKQPSSLSLPGSAANAGLLAIVKGLANQVAADGVIVNAVNPGPTRTERWSGQMEDLAAERGVDSAEVEGGYLKDLPMNRLGEPDEMARLIAFLASDAAGNMTGTSVTADGGWTRSLV